MIDYEYFDVNHWQLFLQFVSLCLLTLIQVNSLDSTTDYSLLTMHTMSF
jgi:hypothetical protein